MLMKPERDLAAFMRVAASLDRAVAESAAADTDRASVTDREAGA